jgi:hypothetical protein
MQFLLILLGLGAAIGMSGGSSNKSSEPSDPSRPDPADPVAPGPDDGSFDVSSYDDGVSVIDTLDLESDIPGERIEGKRHYVRQWR